MRQVGASGSDRPRKSACRFASLLAAVCVVVPCSESVAQGLFEPRFQTFRESQRALLREAVRSLNSLEALYGEFSCRGRRRIITPDGSENTSRFEFARRRGGYQVYRVFRDTGDGNTLPAGLLARPEGYVATTVKPGSLSSEIVAFGGNPDHADDVRFRCAPFAIRFRPFTRLLTDAGRDDRGISRAEFTDLLLHPVEQEKGVVVTVKLKYPPAENGSAERTVSFLRDHSWAISSSVAAETTPNGIVHRSRVDVEYDLSKPLRPRMKRVTYTDFDPGGDNDAVRSLEDYHFEELDFATPDLKLFEPQALGLSIPTPAAGKTSVWPWRLGMIGGGIVLITLALYLRRRMRD